jgi:hypothetical protein
MDRAGALPDRCVACNAAAEGGRLKRKLYYSPASWKIGASLTPFLVLLAGAWLEIRYAFLAFWPLVVILIIANIFVRKSLKLEVGVCRRHREQRLLLITLSWVCFAGVFAGIFTHPLFVLAAVLGLLVLLGLQSYMGVQPLRLADLSREHAWLAGAVKRFREALPELN